MLSNLTLVLRQSRGRVSRDALTERARAYIRDLQMIKDKFSAIGEYAAAGLYEEPERSLFYRKALGIRRFYETCELHEYGGEYLYPSGALTQRMSVFPHYLAGLHCDLEAKNAEDGTAQLFRQLREDFYIYRPTVPREHTVGGCMYTHSMPNYERILKEGLLSYIPRIERIRDTDMREGLIHAVRGVERYVGRCVSYLESVSADPRLITALKRVPLYPARDAYEAIVAWNFVMYLDNCDNLGCLAKGLMPYYKGENLIPLLENLYDNLDLNNGYSMSLDSECPELTVQCLRAAAGKRRPMIELLIDEGTPDAVWDVALETLRSGGGQPAFYNKKSLLGGLKKRFPTIRDEDLDKFCGGGCTESMISGLSNVGSLDAGINLLLILERMMKSHLPSAKTFDEFYDAYLDEVRSVVETVKREISHSREERARYNPLPMRTLLIDDCIDKETEYNSGGARYNWSIINFAGMINVIDSLLAIRSFIFEDRKYSARQLLELLKNNDELFLREAIGCTESFGRDDESVNHFAHRLSSRIFSMTEDGNPTFGEGYLSASIQFMSQADAGRYIGATPDGRASGMPLCDSLAAIFGKDSCGPTALIGSITSLDLTRAAGVPVVNLNITRQFKNDILKALILAYMNMGGIQMQITCASREELTDALVHPERHGNLIVRVGGYSEYFNRLSDDLKRMIIARSVQGEGVL